jgi:hypothetical protein
VWAWHGRHRKRREDRTQVIDRGLFGKDGLRSPGPVTIILFARLGSQALTSLGVFSELLSHMETLDLTVMRGKRIPFWSLRQGVVVVAISVRFLKFDWSRIGLLARRMCGQRARPHTKPAFECIRVVAWSAQWRHFFQLLGVSASKHDVVGL